jgi:hypothetical protein
MYRGVRSATIPPMPVFLLHHRHDASECDVAFAAWAGFDSTLRHRPAASTCLSGGHALWWRVEAADRAAALALLPRYVAERTSLTEVRDIRIP